MADHMYDQNWRRRYNRFDKNIEPVSYCSIRDIRKGKSSHAVRRPYRPDYSDVQTTQYEQWPEVVDNFSNYPLENLDPQFEPAYKNTQYSKERFRSIDS